MENTSKYLVDTHCKHCIACKQFNNNEIKHTLSLFIAQMTDNHLWFTYMMKEMDFYKYL